MVLGIIAKSNLIKRYGKDKYNIEIKLKFQNI